VRQRYARTLVSDYSCAALCTTLPRLCLLAFTWRCLLDLVLAVDRVAERLGLTLGAGSVAATSAFAAAAPGRTLGAAGAVAGDGVLGTDGDAVLGTDGEAPLGTAGAAALGTDGAAPLACGDGAAATGVRGRALQPIAAAAIKPPSTTTIPTTGRRLRARSLGSGVSPSASALSSSIAAAARFGFGGAGGNCCAATVDKI
jgi:hypothetical protein